LAQLNQITGQLEIQPRLDGIGLWTRWNVNTLEEKQTSKQTKKKAKRLHYLENTAKQILTRNQVSIFSIYQE